MISSQIIDQVLNATDIVELIGKRVNLKKKGARYEGLCPFHTEKTPSFQVIPQMGIYYCHGCHRGGNAIRFLMEDENLSFPEAVKRLAKEHNITIPDEAEPTAEERQRELHKEALYLINQKVAEWFQQQLSISKKAREYVSKRWDLSFAQSIGIGYAPDSWDSLYNYAKSAGLNIDLMIEIGLLKKNEQKNRIYDFYRDRITIPIYNKMGRVIGFSCRNISEREDVNKYFNSANSIIYNKEESIFGLNYAFREAIKQDKIYCVEGGPDVLRLHFIKVVNTVASLGSAWTHSQLVQLKRITGNICFIPDADPLKDTQKFPPGTAAVMKYGCDAMKLGFNVTVKPIPIGEGNTKNDPDSYILSKAVFNSIEEEDFITWYAGQLFVGKENTDDRAAAISNIADIIIMIGDEMKEDMYVRKLQQLYKDKSTWQKAISIARKKKKADQVLEKSKTIDRDLFKKYGFYEMQGGYYSMSGNGNENQWSNFTMEPMFHIRDSINPKRMYRIKNQNRQVEIIEMKQEDLISLSKFKLKVEGIGNFIWEASERELVKLKKYLYEQTETATEITQLGWQRGGFYAFGNGIFDGTWKPVDEYGIVRLDKIGNYYLPASSTIYKHDEQLFQFERRFVHLPYNSIGLRDYALKLIDVFGDNGKIGLCFLFSALFRDIIVNYTKSFPILNLFGPKGAGKSELGHSLMSFFIIKNTPPNLSNSTIPALADAVAQCSNALVHLDEFKNNIDLEKREFLKGLWDGTGRSRMNMERDKKREITNVDSGIIVSGQEMATADIALFSRFMFLAFNKTEYSQSEKLKFEELKRIEGNGLSHLTLQILGHRSRMESGFISAYKTCSEDLQAALKDEIIEDRIFRNWLIPITVYKVLEAYIDLPFTYKELLSIFAESIIRQNAECKSNNELANFWSTVNFLFQEGEIFLDADYKITYTQRFKTNQIKWEGITDRPFLILRRSRIFMLYKKYGKMTGETILPEPSLRYYLEKSKEFVGMKNSVRFKSIKKGFEETKTVEINGIKELKNTTNVEQAYCFDYELIKQNYGIDIEVYTDIPEETDDSALPEQKILYLS